jgi:hypothetical protein
MIPSPGTRRSTPEEVAYHEAGHVVVGHALGLVLIDADIFPDGVGGYGHTNFEGMAWFQPERFRAAGAPLDERHLNFIDSVVVTFLAGPAAEARKASRPNLDAAAFDLDRVMREWLVLGGEAPEQQRLDELGRRAQRLVEQECTWKAIERVATALLERRRLTAAEALPLIEPG